MIHGNEGDYGVGSWDVFLIRENIIRQFGLFDENLYPAYCEDADYIMRFIHRPIRKVMSLSKMYYHGFGEKQEYYTHGSQTKKNDPSIAEKLEESNAKNIEYLSKKWGKDWRICAPTSVPFEGDVLPVSTTTYDLDFVRDKNLGF